MSSVEKICEQVVKFIDNIRVSVPKESSCSVDILSSNEEACTLRWVICGQSERVANIRVDASGLLVDINGSQALELSADELEHDGPFEQILKAFTKGELEVSVGSRDGKYYSFRGRGFEYYLPSSPLSSLVSGHKEWVRLI